MNAIVRYICLPSEMSPFEQKYLTRMNQVGVWFFLMHLPLFIAISAINHTNPLLTALLTLATLAGPIVAMRTCSLRTTSVVMGVTAMFMGGILVHIGQGPVQIEMHFYFFVLLALLAVFANPMVIVAAAVTAALHHAILWLSQPASVFNYDAPIWVVGVHASFVVLESVAACYIARSFFDNVVGLEKIIDARTAEVRSRNRDMRMILDAVEQGFFTIDKDGVMSDERSAAVERLLGSAATGVKLVDFLRPIDSSVADWLELGLEDVFAELMPLEVTLDQLPKRIHTGSKILKLDFSPVHQDGVLVALAVVISDIGALVAREQLEAEHRMMISMLDRISKDKAGFLEFVGEAQTLVDSFANAHECDINTLKRNVHTLKGNAGIFGLDLIAEKCHSLENLMAETGEIPSAQHWDKLRSNWTGVMENIRRLVGEFTTGIMLGDQEYADIMAGILNNDSRDHLVWRVASWRLEPTKNRMSRIADQARILARRYGKGDLDIEISGGDYRIDPDHWAPFWSAFVHVVRNAVDHGLESTEERIECGKPTAGSIRLSTMIVEDRFVVSLSDDGRGIDWNKVADRAKKQNLPCESRADLVDALFHEGFSTKDEVSELSGRGVGMSAIKKACQDMHGHLEITSELNVGTTIQFWFPISEMSPSTVALLSRHGISKPERVFGIGNARPSSCESFDTPTDSSSFGQHSALGV